MAVTYNDLYMDTRQVLLDEKIPGASIEAREIVCYAAGKTRDEFLRDMRIYVPDNIRKDTETLLSRRLSGEPVAYLIGEWEFYGITLNLNRHVLIPRSDTEVLVDTALKKACEFPPNLRILDLCSGSGCVGIALALKLPEARVSLFDISEEAVKISRQNVRRCDLSSRISCVITDALKMPEANVGEFDIIVCNPPYIPTDEIETLDRSVRGYEPRLALDGGTDGLDFYRAIIKNWRDTLKPGGKLFFECGINQIAHVHELLRENGFLNIEKFDDTQGIGRVIAGDYGVKQEVSNEGEV